MPEHSVTTEATMTVTATPRSQQYLDSLNNLQLLANAQTVPSGILHTAPATLFSMARYDGAQAAALRQDQWEQHYHDLHRGIVSGSALAQQRLPALPDLSKKAQEQATRQVVPIAIFNLQHHYPNKRLMTAVSAAARHDRAIRLRDDPRHMLEERRGFAASALLPDCFENFQLLPHQHHGLRVRFLLDPALYLTNTDEPLGFIEADFADGLGFRPLPPNRPVTVQYREPGAKHVRVTQHTAAGPRTTSFVFNVGPAAAVQPDTTFNVNATIPYQGKTNSGIAGVWYGSTNGVKHTQLTNPIIISEGFPGGYSWDYLYGMLNTQGALTALLSKGYDAVVLTYGQPGANGGSDYIQRNAFVVVACIQQVISRRAGNAPLIVGGASMGGVITRYALAYMEKNNIAHQTQMFLSFDSPQQGASVPVSVQWFIQALATTNAEAAKIAQILSSPAAQQMLTYYVPSYTYSGPLTAALHTAFYTELSGLGYPHGSPQQPVKTIGIADGAGNGVKTIPDGAHVIDWSGNICAYGDTWAEPTGAGQVGSLYCAPISFWKQFSHSVQNCVNYDGAPGGTSPANGQLAQQLINSDYGSVDHNYDINCFIPTVSALDIKGATAYTPVPAQGAASAFDAYFVSATNNAHVLITPQILTFLLSQLPSTVAAPAAAQQMRAVPAGANGSGRIAGAPAPTFNQTAEFTPAVAPFAEGQVVVSTDGSTACVVAWDGVYVFAQSQGTWALQTKLSSPSTSGVAISQDGSVIAISSPFAKTATVCTGTNWSTQSLLPLPALSQNSDPSSIALSDDGTLALVGVMNLSSDSASPGQAFLFQSSSGNWTQAASFTGAASEQLFGADVALSGDGTVAVVSGVIVTDTWPKSGFAYAFSGANWSNRTALPTPSGALWGYGAECAVNANGSVIAVASLGAYSPPNNLPGTIFIFSGQDWQQQSSISNPNTIGNILFSSPCLSADGNTLAACASTPASPLSQTLYVFTHGPSGWALISTPPLPTNAQNANGLVAMSGDGSIIMVRANSGAYALSGQNWTQATLLPTPVDVAGLDFGTTVAVNGKGTNALIGAPGVNSLVGAAYLYGTNGANWTQLNALASPDTQAWAQFACAVALSANADTAACGVRGDDNDAGCVYLFSGFNWSDQTRLTAPNPVAGDNLGVSVALSEDGSVCVVGAPGTNSNTGAIWVFSGANWSQRTCLVATSGQAEDNCGMSVAVSSDGSVIVAGAPNANGGSGAVYVFSGANWSQQTALALSGSPADAAFGQSVAISSDGTLILVGAPQMNNGVGAAYVFSGSAWSQQQTIPVTGNPGDTIGDAVAMSGNGSIVLLGAPGTNNGTGAAYVASGPGYGNITQVVASDAVPGDGFGDAVGLDLYGDIACIGAPGRNYESGVMFVFTSAAVAAPKAATAKAATTVVARLEESLMARQMIAGK